MTPKIKKFKVYILPLLLCSLFILSLASFNLAYGDDTNLAVMPTDWGFYYSESRFVKGADPQIIFVDAVELYNGSVTGRIDGPGIGDNYYREIDWTGEDEYHIAVSPNGTICMRAWTKTEKSTNGADGLPNKGAIMGFDMYHDYRRVWEIADGDYSAYIYNSSFSTYVNYTWTPYGTSTWTFLELNYTFPDYYFTEDDFGVGLGGSYQINYIIPWLEASWSDPLESASVWFAATEIYINPTPTGPTPTPTPTPTSTPVATPSPIVYPSASATPTAAPTTAPVSSHSPETGIDVMNLPLQVGVRLDLDLFSSQLLVTAFLVLLTTAIVGFSARKSALAFPMIVIADFLVMGICTALTWLPVWTFAVAVLLAALLAGGKIKGLI